MLIHLWLDHPLWLLASALLMALVLDLMLGEPRAPLHPVVWMGHYLSVAGRWVQRGTDPFALPGRAADPQGALRGALAWGLGAAMVLAAALLVQSLLSWVASSLVLALALKPMFSWRMLRDEVAAVERALQGPPESALQAARAQLARLVSRDVEQLDAEQVRESAIETLAENLNDSVVSPLLWFALLGLPGAALYRFANTADAMWGYRGLRQGVNWEWAGKWAARVDDVLSWPGARLTALLLLALHPGGLRRLADLPAQARLTPSPNSGWPMAAMALALNIRLRKPGVYVLHAQGQGAQRQSTRQALRLAQRAVAATAAGVVAVVLVASYPALLALLETGA